MKYLILVMAGILGNISVGAEIWEKPKYMPDEGHLQEEIQRQEEERPKFKIKKEEKHQDVKRNDSSPKLKKDGSRPVENS